MQLINSYTQLEAWLDENHYFESGYILRIDSNPLRITVGFMISGSLLAHSENRFVSFQITPHNIIQWDGFPKDPVEDYYISGISSLDLNTGIGLQFEDSELITLIAESLMISDPEIVTMIRKPWMSDREIFAQAPVDIPRADFWQQKLQEYGHEILFRYYAGPARLAVDVPYPNYSGYFIQKSNQISSTQYGICIQFVSLSDGTFSIGLRNFDDQLANVWVSLTAILADFPQVEISCGNCKFTGMEWKQLLADKKYPSNT